MVVSQYFPPEPGATQNRIGTFAFGLATRGHRVTVVCEQPCHPVGVFQEGYGRRPLMTERTAASAGTGPVTIERLWVAASPKKTAARRLAFYGSFAGGAALAVAAARSPDVVLASSPPLPGVLTAAAVARLRGIPLVTDVRDVWPAAAEALGELSSPGLVRTLERGERWLYRASAAVTATTRPFTRHIDRLAGRPVSIHLPNGALDDLVQLPERPPPARTPFVVGYAGNLGIAQGLDIVLDAAERLGEDCRFVLVGGGPLTDRLRAECVRRRLENVELRPPVPVDEVGEFLQDCHALLVPLRAHPLLADFIPSKLYDAMAVGRPVLVAARGEAAELTRETGAGMVVEPEDGAALAEAVRALARDPARASEMGAAGRRAAAPMARSQQLDRLEDVLLRAAGRAA